MVKEQILKFSTFGANPDGSVSRVFGSESYRQAAEAMREYMAECGMESYIDQVGNVHGIYRAGSSRNKKEILVGSHLDTVKEGGMFDGLLGIVAGIECVQRLQTEGKVLNCNLHLIAANGEEGNDLGGTFGSRCLAGTFDLSVPGIEKKAEDFGLSSKAIRESEMDFDRIQCYLELHIEQGKTLEESGQEIGIVTGIVGLQRYEILIQGESNHAGTTMMEYRKDALVEAAKIIAVGDQLARDLGNSLVATFSKVEIHPNTIAVINNQVRMILEFRNQDEMLMEQFAAELQRKFAGERNGLKVTFTPLVKKKPVQCDTQIIEAMDRACERTAVSWRQMPSGATHDGNMMALRTPIGMIFVPSRGGISHSGEEWTDWEQCEKGVDVLYETLLELGGAK